MVYPGIQCDGDGVVWSTTPFLSLHRWYDSRCSDTAHIKEPRTQGGKSEPTTTAPRFADAGVPPSAVARPPPPTSSAARRAQRGRTHCLYGLRGVAGSTDFLSLTLSLLPHGCSRLVQRPGRARPHGSWGRWCSRRIYRHGFSESDFAGRNRTRRF